MKIKMELRSDVIFGNGVSVPGGEDISVLCDEYGFPYYKGSTLKGIFREELIRLLVWKGLAKTKEEAESQVTVLLGKSGEDYFKEERKLIFSDFHLSDQVKNRVLEEIGTDNKQEVLNCFTHLRTFTSISEDGLAKDGTLRIGRCVNKGICFFSELICDEKDQDLVKEVLRLIKWVGTMRNRGFGKVCLSVID